MNKLLCGMAPTSQRWSQMNVLISLLLSILEVVCYMYSVWLCILFSSTVLQEGKITQNFKWAQTFEMHTFQQHTSSLVEHGTCYLSDSWAVGCKLWAHQTPCMTRWDNKRSPKSINFKRASVMFTRLEKGVTKATLVFLNSTIPVFEGFLTFFQKSGSIIHYDIFWQIYESNLFV